MLHCISLAGVSVRRDVGAGDEEGVRVKENAILELGALLSAAKQADGNFWKHLLYGSLQYIFIYNLYFLL